MKGRTGRQATYVWPRDAAFAAAALVAVGLDDEALAVLEHLAYEDRSREKHIYEITAGEVALVRGTVIEVKKNNFPYARGKKQLLRVSISDGIQVMEAIYFNVYY